MTSITLRALEPEDLDLIYRIENDQELWKWGCNSVPFSRYLIRQYIENQRGDIFLDEEVRQIICLDGKPVGIIDLANFDTRHLRAEVGIIILSEYQRQGIGRQAFLLLHEYAHKIVHLRSLYAWVAEDNIPARQFFLNEDYTEVGRMERWLDGEFPAILFQKLL